MTNNASDIAFKIILIEDHKATRNTLCSIIKKVLSTAEIGLAESVEEGLALIEKARQAERPYDVALLDFYLPQRPGLNRELDTSVCQSLRKDGTPIIHFTAYPKDDEIRAHMAEVHCGDDLYGSPIKLIGKRGKWGEEILKYLLASHQHIINRGIERRMDAVFGFDNQRRGGDAVEQVEYGRFPENFVKSGTFDMIHLEDAIVENWKFVEPDLRDRIKRTFAVVELDGQDRRLSRFPIEV